MHLTLKRERLDFLHLDEPGLRLLLLPRHQTGACVDIMNEYTKGVVDRVMSVQMNAI